jgi:hypothetical protein
MCSVSVYRRVYVSNVLAEVCMCSVLVSVYRCIGVPMYVRTSIYRLKHVQCIGLNESMYRRVYVRVSAKVCTVYRSQCIGVSMYLCIG